MIKKTSAGYQVKSKSGAKNLGKYKTKKAAVKRLREVEYFKKRSSY